MSTETHITHGNADRVGPLLESGFFTTEEERRGVPPSDDKQIGEFTSTLKSATDKGYVKTEGPLRTSDLPVELQNITERNKSRKSVAILAALGLTAAAGIFAVTRGGEDDTPRVTPPVASGTPTPGASTPELSPSAQPSPTTTESGGFIENKTKPFVEARVPDTTLNFDFLNKYDMAKLNPSAYRKYMEALPGNEFGNALDLHDTTVTTITVNEIATAKGRLEEVLGAKYTMIENGKITSGLNADKFFEPAGFQPGTTMAQIERLIDNPDSTLAPQEVATELYNQSTFASNAVTHMYKQERALEQHVIQQPEDAGFVPSQLRTEQAAMMAQLRPTAETVSNEIANAQAGNYPIVKDLNAYIVRVYDRLEPMKAPDGTTVQVKAFTILAETTANELVMRTVLAYSLDKALVTSTATMETKLVDVEGKNYFQVVPVITSVFK